jgi:hypothetical protein
VDLYYTVVAHLLLGVCKILIINRIKNMPQLNGINKIGIGKVYGHEANVIPSRDDALKRSKQFKLY